MADGSSDEKGALEGIVATGVGVEERMRGSPRVRGRAYSVEVEVEWVEVGLCVVPVTVYTGKWIAIEVKKGSIWRSGTVRGRNRVQFGIVV